MNPSKNKELIEKAPHYNTRTIEAIEFIRHMDFATGNAFKYVWRFGLKDISDLEAGKRNYYIRDALVYRPSALPQDHCELLVRKLAVIADQFEEKQFCMLVALLVAASGDYALLTEQARGEKVLPPKAGAVLYGGEE